MKLQERLFTAIREHNLLPYGTGTIVAGVSGGADSLALLHLLASLCQQMVFHRVRLHVATLDHGLRGAAGADDARFVVETAQAWGLNVTSGYADVRALAQERHISIEAAARTARYDFLSSVAHEVGAERVAAAHNADDQVETILLHLLRGAGFTGLSGMAYAVPLPGHPDLTLIRPLLDVPRAELDAYCREQGLQPRHDASNADVRYTRNRLRHQTIPLLRAVSPQMDRRLLQLGEIARVEGDFADQALHAAVDPHIQRSDKRIALPRAVFGGLHAALQRRFIIWAAHTLGAVDVGTVHIAAAVELALRGEVGARAQLKSGVQLRVDYETVVVEYDDAPAAAADDLPLLPPNAVIPVAVPGTTPINANWILNTSLILLDGVALRLALHENSTLVLRGRHSGDRFKPLGLGGKSKKIGEWMIDRKVPRLLRERLPLLVAEGEIAAVWWHGWVVSEKYAITGQTEQIVYIGLNRTSDEQL